MKKILVVDDEKEIRELIKDRLSQNKFEVILAQDAKEALRICKTNPPDLILLDIAMPEIDGYETCKRLKQEKSTKDIPVIFLTGKDLAPEAILDHCRDLSAAGYTSKLSTLKELIDKVKEALR